MGKKSNVNPDHFKTAGREPQGQDVVHEVQRQQYAEAKIREKRTDPGTAANDVSAQPSDDAGGRQGVSSKKGKQSSAQKMDSTRHNFDTVPAAQPVAGAFGKRPPESGDETKEE